MEDRDPSVRARHLGRVLTHAMQVKGLTRQKIAAELGWSPSRVSRVLAGKRPVLPLDLSALLAVCGITGPLRDRLLTLAEQAQTQTPWCEDHGPCLPAELPALSELEDTAASLTCVDMLAVPTLGQTGDYRSALLHGTPVIPNAEIPERVMVHHIRQELVLNRHNPPTIRFFLTEQALSSPGMDRDILRDQAYQLLRLATRPNIQIRVIPANRSAPTTCPSFQFMTFPDGRPVVYAEQLTSTTFLDNPTTAASYDTLLTEIDTIALNPELSHAKLAQVAAAALGEPLSQSGVPEAECDDWVGQLLITSSGQDADEHDGADP